MDANLVASIVVLLGFALFCWLWWQDSRLHRRYRKNRFIIPYPEKRVVCNFCGCPVRRVDAREYCHGEWTCDCCEGMED